MLLIADTTVISNFFLIGRLDLLEGIKDLCATKEVWDELEAANKKGILEISQTDLKSEILRMNEDEIESFLRLCSRFGRGEAVESLDRFLP